MSVPVSQLVSDAFRELSIYTPSDTIPAEDSAYALTKLNRLLGRLEQNRAFTFSEVFSVFTLIPNHNPHTIGPTANSPDFTTKTRPISVRHAVIILTDGSNVRRPMTVENGDVGAETYANIPLQTVTTTIPWFLYYQPGWPLGSIYLYPVPTVNYNLEITNRLSLLQGSNADGGYQLTDTFDQPLGYQDAVTDLLAQEIASAYPGAVVSQELANRIANIWGAMGNNNVHPPKLKTQNPGMPTRATGRGTFNWTDGSVV